MTKAAAVTFPPRERAPAYGLTPACRVQTRTFAKERS